MLILYHQAEKYFLLNNYYSQVLEIGVINNTIHKVDENVAIKDLEKLTNLYYEILKKYFNKNKFLKCSK